MIPAEVLRISPLRSPQWRYDRVMQMLRHRPEALLPTRFDDHPIRRARMVLLELEAARDEAARECIYRDEASMWHALSIYYSPDPVIRHMLEAYLLLHEVAFDEIATRFATSPETISYFHDLFFDVRPYLENSDWIGKNIRGDLDAFSSKANSSADAFGYVLKLFAYRGGRLVLEAAINRISAGDRPKSGADVSLWMENAFSSVIRNAAVAAAIKMRLNSKDALRLIKVALKLRVANRVDNEEGTKSKEHLDKAIPILAASLKQSSTSCSGQPAKEDEAGTWLDGSPEPVNRRSDEMPGG